MVIIMYPADACQAADPCVPPAEASAMTLTMFSAELAGTRSPPFPEWLRVHAAPPKRNIFPTVALRNYKPRLSRLESRSHREDAE